MLTYIDAGSLGEELEVEVTYDYTPSTQDVMYDKNGDPGWPGDPETVDITNIRVIKYGFDIDLKEFNEYDYDLIVDQIIEYESKGL